MQNGKKDFLPACAKMNNYSSYPQEIGVTGQVTKMTRRGFVLSAIAGTVAGRAVLGNRGEKGISIKHGGVFIHECSIPGETRKEDVFPAHPNGIRLSRDRFLIIYATRGFRGIDEDRSIIYQVRSASFEGPILKEGIFAVSIDNWDPLADGKLYKKINGAPTAFGVPKGALIRGRKVRHSNLFVAKWYQYARAFSAPDRLYKATETRDLTEKTLHVESVQFRLNEIGDDIEILEPTRPLRQKGFERGEAYSSAAARGSMNQSFVAPVPFNEDATEWIDMHQFSGAGLAGVKYRYNPKLHRYVWVETGPSLFYPDYPASEASVVRLRDGWGICARPAKAGLPVLWTRTENPFSNSPKKVYAQKFASHPLGSGPVTAYRCADGVIRILAGDPEASPYKKSRNPLYCWDVDPDKEFSFLNRREVIDLIKAGLPFRLEANPYADMAKLLPHTGGNKQLIIHRVRTQAINYSANVPVAVTAEEKHAHGIYYARVEYAESYPDPWDFARTP